MLICSMHRSKSSFGALGDKRKAQAVGGFMLIVHQGSHGNETKKGIEAERVAW